MDDICRTGCEIRTLFDVGANVGQAAFLLREAFPEARIHCFEPVEDTFKQLIRNVRHPLTACHRLALGSTPSEAETVFITGNTVTNTLIAPAEYLGAQSVKVSTIDAIAIDLGIDQIDLVKIDTEGYDIEVLRGAEELLLHGRVSFIVVEVGFDPADRRHVLFDDARGLLAEKGFGVFGIYNQTLEWTGQRKLRYADVVFSYLGTDREERCS